jgi:hypothetical protein
MAELRLSPTVTTSVGEQAVAKSGAARINVTKMAELAIENIFDDIIVLNEAVICARPQVIGVRRHRTDNARNNYCEPSMAYTNVVFLT